MAMMDLHAHILPNVDDGSNSVKTSLGMLQRMKEQGIAVLCATPHFYANEDTTDSFCAKRGAAWVQLRDAIGDMDTPHILLGAEVAWFPRLSESPDLPHLCLENTNTLLLEMPFCDWSPFLIEEVNTLSLDMRQQIILAHPERFCFSRVNRRWLERLAQLPVGFQINAGSLLHRRSRGLAIQLLELTRIPLLGSDCHNLTNRPPNLAKGRVILEKELGVDFLSRIDYFTEQLTMPSRTSV